MEDYLEKAYLQARESIYKNLLNGKTINGVTNEVKIEIEKIISKLNILGSSFSKAYRSMSQLRHKKRICNGEAIANSIGSMIYGKSMSEEEYQCGIHATKSVLELDDWIIPNESDVQICIVLCERIDLLESLGLLKNHSGSTDE